MDMESTRRDVIKAFPSVVAHPDISPSGSSSSPSVPPIDRAKLGAIIFADPSARHRLNQLMKWPIIMSTLRAIWRAYWAGIPAIVVDAPLLFESKLDKICSLTITIYIEKEEDQIARLLERDAKVLGKQPLTAEEAKARIEAQMSTKEKRKRSTYEVDNSGTNSELENRLDLLMATIKHKHKPLLPRSSLLIYITTIFFLVLMYIASRWPLKGTNSQ